MLSNRHRWSRVILWAAVIAMIVGMAPDGSAQSMFTPLAAAREALRLVEEMMAAQQLDAGWGGGLTAVGVSIRNVKGFSEYVVKITRRGGDPSSVSLYFNMNGENTGSSLEAY